ncbi:unnamed protein product [Dovyalis caffra]|uniref:Uncharacterized protein n=1 Tax=Dovyalis caffra TaxID=77055 RepID=A0AAV1RL04_9ROSI|nr:unnamed protein product [Dovyalis caffra]
MEVLLTKSCLCLMATYMWGAYEAIILMLKLLSISLISLSALYSLNCRATKEEEIERLKDELRGRDEEIAMDREYVRETKRLGTTIESMRSDLESVVKSALSRLRALPPLPKQLKEKHRMGEEDLVGAFASIDNTIE